MRLTLILPGTARVIPIDTGGRLGADPVLPADYMYVANRYNSGGEAGEVTFEIREMLRQMILNRTQQLR